MLGCRRSFLCSNESFRTITSRNVRETVALRFGANSIQCRIGKPLEKENQSMDKSKMRLATRAIHVGNEKDPLTGAVVPPLHVATTFVQPEVGKFGDYDYTRTANPSRRNLELTVASLENGFGALAFSSGMAATHNATLLLNAGDHLVTGKDIYGGSYRLFHKILTKHQIRVTQVDTSNLSEIDSAITPETKMLWLESPGNPLMTITDLKAATEFGKSKGLLVAVDNTFATPVLTRPIDFGADLVMHSATKYFGGHSDAMGGILVAANEEVFNRLSYLENATGGIMGSLETFLIARGLKTLSLRVNFACESAMKIAGFLDSHSAIEKVYYPGLESHLGHETAKSQMSGKFGAMMSFEVRGGMEQAAKVVNNTKLFQLAVSLGAVESLIEQPATLSHASYDREDRLAHGIKDELIRISVGCEDPEDLIEDLTEALANV